MNFLNNPTIIKAILPQLKPAIKGLSKFIEEHTAMLESKLEANETHVVAMVEIENDEVMFIFSAFNNMEWSREISRDSIMNLLESSIQQFLKQK